MRMLPRSGFLPNQASNGVTDGHVVERVRLSVYTTQLTASAQSLRGKDVFEYRRVRAPSTRVLLSRSAIPFCWGV